MKLILSFVLCFLVFADDIDDRFNSLINRDPEVKSVALWIELLNQMKLDPAKDFRSIYLLDKLVTKGNQSNLIEETLTLYRKLIQKADDSSSKFLLDRAMFCKKLDKNECFERSIAEILYAYPNSNEYLRAQALYYGDESKNNQNRNYKGTVILDPGHGGHDLGAKANQLIEKDLVFDIALRVKEILEADNIKVVLTRNSDEFVPLLERSQIANDYEANLLVSLHANAGSRANEGFEFYYYDDSKISNLSERENNYAEKKLGNINKAYPKEKSRALTSFLSDKFELIFGNKFKYTINGSRFYILQESQIPAVLLELLYVDNLEHSTNLKSSQFRQQLSQAISDGITEYVNQ